MTKIRITIEFEDGTESFQVFSGVAGAHEWLEALETDISLKEHRRFLSDTVENDLLDDVRYEGQKQQNELDS